MILSTHGVLASQIASFDADAVAFFTRVTTAGGSLTLTEKQAVNTLVVDMKAYGIWSAMKAIYPMVGASAAACAQNLNSSSFTGTFSSGWTFASTGVTPNGTSAYMNTGLTPSSILTVGNNHASYYSRTQYLTPTAKDQNLWGALNSANYFFADIYNSTPRNYTTNGGSSFLDATLSNTQGLISTSIINTSLNGQKTYQNGIVKGTNTNAVATLPSVNVYFAALNNNGSTSNFAPFECALASIGDGLTDTQASNFYTAVQAFQTTLSRQV